MAMLNNLMVVKNKLEDRYGLTPNIFRCAETYFSMPKFRTKDPQPGWLGAQLFERLIGHQL